LEAIEKVKKRECCGYRIIFMDCMMPGMDGFDATKYIKQIYSQYNEAPKIIGLSALS
jgi:CheY-like chemotaxis protein